jgi:SAM-dependent methyltransferase
MQPANVVGLQEVPAGTPLPTDSRTEITAKLDRIDRERYGQLRHLASCLDELGVAGRRVLEVGLGDGADAEQLIRRGARYSGIDIDAATVERVATRMKTRDLSYDALRHGDVADLPWPSDSFDIVYSHGLLDRIDHLAQAQTELHRVLRPGGQLVVMVRARRSIDYQIGLKVLRRAGLVARYPLARLGVRFGGRAGERLAVARADGLRAALDADALLAWEQGPEGAPARVFTRKELAAAFPSFTVSRTHQHLAPGLTAPLAPLFGWHLWVHLTPKA